MLFRAIFWIGVVALFAPHGETHLDASGCEHAACAAPLGLRDRAESSLLHRLFVVRDEIEAAERARNPQ